MPTRSLGLLCVGLSIMAGIFSLESGGSESSANAFLCFMCCCTVLPLVLWLGLICVLFLLSLPSMIALI